MDITVYLPDDLGNRAKEADLKFSRMLRDAVLDELERQDALAASRDGMVEQLVDVDTDNGALRLRFTGKCVAGTEPDVYLTDEGRVVVVWEERYDTFDSVDEFADWVSDYEARNNLGQQAEATVASAVERLGGRVVVDL